MRRRPKTCASKLYGTAHVRRTKPEINIFLQFVGFSINVADLFVFAGSNWENPVPKF